jgi:S-formylglutathione hydrolase
LPGHRPARDDVADEPDNWQFGKGARFYLNATEEPFARNYNMETYLLDELPRLLDDSDLAIDFARQSIFGHSMGGHGAITLALKNPEGFAVRVSLRSDCPTIHGRLVATGAREVSLAG